MSNDVLLRVFFFALLIVSTLAATTRSRGKKKVAKETKEVNICDIEGRQAPVYCYCDNNGLRNATDANCLVLNRFKVDDTMWSYFVSQIYLTKLALTVRASGTLDYIPTDVLRQLKHLKIVVFQYAKIEELAERSFSNLSSIVEINLSRNMIVVLKKHAFENVKELNVINLDDNRISEINR